jgi:YD repeat-containing protein
MGSLQEGDKQEKHTKAHNDTTATYAYNALSQRIKKQTAAGTTTYAYNLTGQLIAETGASGREIDYEMFLKGYTQDQKSITRGNLKFWTNKDEYGNLFLAWENRYLSSQVSSWISKWS